jgi:cytochrome P450
MIKKTNSNRLRMAESVPLRRTIPGLMRDPLIAFEKVGKESGGAIVRLNLGLFRPYLVTRPAHVQHVLRDHVANYTRDGMFWKPFRRLIGNGISGEGPTWAAHRRIFSPLFSAKMVASMADQMVGAICEAAERLDNLTRTGRSFDASVEMTRIVDRTFSRTFFGERLSTADGDRLSQAVATAMMSLGARMLLPFVPRFVPLPGDASYRHAARMMSEVIYPLIRESRERARPGPDILTLLCHARDQDGQGLSDREIRDDVVALYVAGTESTGVSLTWLWVVLHSHPDVAMKLYEEIRNVVGAGRPTYSHLEGLTYTKMVIQEALRMYPPGWILPRSAMANDVIDNVQINRGDTVLISPYLTHRMEELWDHPHTFDPGRFAPDRAEHRHRFSYIPFGAGPHTCLGSHLFMVEMQLILAVLLRRYRLVLHNSSPVVPRAAVSLRPRQRVIMSLEPLGQRGLMHT